MVLALLTFMLGPVVVSNTPTDIFPNINIPVIAVAWSYTGLNAEELSEDSLAALRILEQEARQQEAATAAAKDSLRVSIDRYLAGADPYLQVLTAQTIALANERNDVEIMRRRMISSVLLIKSLGGGWTTTESPSLAAGQERFK